MPIRIPRGWEIPERQASPEHLVFGRRKAFGLGAGLLAASPALAQGADGLPPAMRNTRYVPGRDITAERDATTYNNFYEFGTDKGISRAAQRLPQRPWTVKVEGMVETPREFGIEDLLRSMPIEERVYRLRCVEAWSMVVPWTGFPLSALLSQVKPLASAKYVVFETAALPRRDAGPAAILVSLALYRGLHHRGGRQRAVLHGGRRLRQAAAAAEWRADPLPPAVEIRLQGRQEHHHHQVDRPAPGVVLGAHPGAGIRLLGQCEPRGQPSALEPGERAGASAPANACPTRLFNGYAEFVAPLYTGLQNERLWA